MSSFWKQVAMLLIAILEQLINLPADQDHTQVAKAGLSAARRLMPPGGDSNEGQ